MASAGQAVESDPAALVARWYGEGHFTDRTFADEIRRAAERYPDAGFVFASESGQQRMMFPEVLASAHRVAAGLRQLGVAPGDTIAIQVPNRPELVIAYYAAFLAGAVVVPITHIYGPKEMSFILRESRARVLVVPDTWRSIDYRERVDRLVDTPELAHIVVIGEHEFPGSTRWDTLAEHAPTSLSPVRSSDDVCTMLYTSGTTSAPKGVRHTHNTLLAEMRSVAPMLGLRRGDTKLVPWPAGHVAGLIGICAGVVSGITSVLMDHWDVALAVRLIERHRCAATSGTPLHVAGLLDEAAATGRDIGSLRYVQVGGANVPPELVRRADAVGISVARAYGSTEHPTCATHGPAAPPDKRAGTDGRPGFGDEIRIVDDTGRQLPAGVDGDIVTRGPARFVGYQDPDLNAESFLSGDWFLTGDIGHLDQDGYLTVTDRRKDVIIRGGENIASKEVEDILAMHPAVREAAVVGQPDPTYGERVAAFVILHDGKSLHLDDVRGHFQWAGVARQKTPERLIAVDQLPRTPSGKVQKFALRERLRQGSVDT